MAAVRRQNISVDPETYDEFCKYASKKGIKLSTWVTMKMKEFIDEEKLLEEIKSKKGL